MIAQQWCWVTDEVCRGPFTREEAIAEAANYAERVEDLKGYSIAPCVFIEPSKYVSTQLDVEDFLQSVEESNEDPFCCFEEGPILVPKGDLTEAQDALELALAIWASKYVTANGQWTAGDEVECQEELLAAFKKLAPTRKASGIIDPEETP